MGYGLILPRNRKSALECLSKWNLLPANSGCSTYPDFTKIKSEDNGDAQSLTLWGYKLYFSACRVVLDIVILTQLVFHSMVWMSLKCLFKQSDYLFTAAVVHVFCSHSTSIASNAQKWELVHFREESHWFGWALERSNSVACTSPPPPLLLWCP